MRNGKNFYVTEEVFVNPKRLADFNFQKFCKYTFNLFLNKFSSFVVLSSCYLFITSFWTSCNQCLQPSSLRVLLRVAGLSRLHLTLVYTDIINRVTHKMTAYNIFQQQPGYGKATIRSSDFRNIGVSITAVFDKTLHLQDLDAI